MLRAWALARLSGPPDGSRADEFPWDAHALPGTDFSGGADAGPVIYERPRPVRMGAEPAGKRRLLPHRSAGARFSTGNIGRGSRRVKMRTFEPRTSWVRSSVGDERRVAQNMLFAALF